jgi:hypothetical protein
MNKNFITICLAVLLSAVIGFVGGWFIRSVRADREIQQIGLAHELENIGFSAGALRCIQEGQNDRLDTLLWFGVRSSLEAAETKVNLGVRLPGSGSYASLVDSVDRARSVAEHASNESITMRLTLLHSTLVPTQ